MSLVLYIFNIGYLFQHLGTFLQIRRIERKRDTGGVSIDTQILFLLGALARMYWITDTLLKGFYLTYIELAFAMSSLSYTLYLCLYKYNLGYTGNNTSLPIFCRWYFILILSLVLSYNYFPGNNGQSYDIQMFVSFNIFAEAGGLLPQIYSVNRQKDSNIFSSFYVMCLTVSRILRLCFWLKLYMEDSSFGFLIAADLLHLLFVSGFIYSFFRNSDGLVLPTVKKIF
jgi:hypothetical protein